MKRISSLFSIILVIGVVIWSFSDLKPSLSNDNEISEKQFSIHNALHHLKIISEKEHFVGAKNHKKVQSYIASELQKMGLEVDIQVQTSVNQRRYAFSTTAENIIAKIKGTENGKALMLLTHYDSSSHSSFGASDAGSGVVTILEGVRAFLAQNKKPNNDIIILISDAEELGLLGAKAFVDNHPWTKDIGLILNFEARGSGGPSYMLMETNGGNSELIKSFVKSQPNYPAANSLLYSIYKILPNDTDLTVFREKENINGFNFAFIGDHFDYHTAQDTYERLDRETLMHQGDYLTSSLNYFANADLNNLNSQEDYIYVNFPFTTLLIYPYSWVIPMLSIAIILFIILLFFGFSMKKISVKGSLKGFLPFIISLVICGGFSYFLWKLILEIHPAYKDMLHGFTYNGYTYITAFTFLNIWILLKVYKYFRKAIKATDLIIAPICIWLIINILISNSLRGASFFIIPVYCALLILALSIFLDLETRSKRILCTILSIPTIYIFSPFIKQFPVGLGLSNLFISAILIVLVFGLMIITFHQKKSSWPLKLSGILTIIFFGIASYNSGFSENKKKPNSIVYVQNSDDKTAVWGTYNNTLDDFTKQIFSEDAHKGSIKNGETKSKYNTQFKFYKEASFKNITSSETIINIDTIIANKRFLEVEIQPKRKINKLEFKTKSKISLQQFKVNDVLVNSGKNYNVNNGTFLIYNLGNSDESVVLSFSVDKETSFDVFVNEISFDLLTNTNFDLKPRSENMMPTPFVTNDAIIISKKIKI